MKRIFRLVVSTITTGTFSIRRPGMCEKVKRVNWSYQRASNGHYLKTTLSAENVTACRYNIKVRGNICSTGPEVDAWLKGKVWTTYAKPKVYSKIPITIKKTNYLRIGKSQAIFKSLLCFYYEYALLSWRNMLIVISRMRCRVQVESAEWHCTVWTH